jgi:hypothetical protein
LLCRLAGGEQFYSQQGGKLAAKGQLTLDQLDTYGKTASV